MCPVMDREQNSCKAEENMSGGVTFSIPLHITPPKEGPQGTCPTEPPAIRSDGY